MERCKGRACAPGGVGTQSFRGDAHPCGQPVIAAIVPWLQSPLHDCAGLFDGFPGHLARDSMT